MNKKYQKSFPGGKKARFTLIELLVVVLIIGILAGVALPQYSLSVRKTRAVTALAFLNKVMEAAEVYFLANGVYPTSYDDLDITFSESIYPYVLGIENEGFTWRVSSSKAGYPILYVHGSQQVPHYGHMRYWRICIGGTDETAAVCRAMGGIQDKTYSYRFYLPVADMSVYGNAVSGNP